MNKPRILAVVVACLSVTAFADGDLSQAKKRASSDDASSVEEATFHGMARATIIQSVEKNKLGAGGRGFRVKRNPLGNGCFVYETHTNLAGNVSKLVWWVTTNNTAYALNAPSKLVTPSLKWPRDDGLYSPTTLEIVDYVFEKKPLPTPKLGG